MCDALSRTIRRRINDSKEILKLFKHEGIRPHTDGNKNGNNE